MNSLQYANAAQCQLKTISGGIRGAVASVELAEAGLCGGAALLADAMDHGFDEIEIEDYSDQTGEITRLVAEAKGLLKKAQRKKGRLSKQINQRFYDINPGIPQPQSGT